VPFLSLDGRAGRALIDTDRDSDGGEEHLRAAASGAILLGFRPGLDLRGLSVDPRTGVL
jgi:hypothetical protein